MLSQEKMQTTETRIALWLEKNPGIGPICPNRVCDAVYGQGALVLHGTTTKTGYLSLQWEFYLNVRKPIKIESSTYQITYCIVRLQPFSSPCRGNHDVDEWLLFESMCRSICHRFLKLPFLDKSPVPCSNLVYCSLYSPKPQDLLVCTMSRSRCI